MYTIYCDGGSIGNNDKTTLSYGYGSFIIKPEIMEVGFRQRFGSCTNNEAEYLILIASLQYLNAALYIRQYNLKEQEVLIRTDSQLVIGQLSKNWKVKAENLIELNQRAKKEIQKFKSVEFKHISGIEMKKILGH